MKALDEMPNIEVEKMIIKSGDNELLDILASKPSFKTKKNLFKVLEYRVDYYDKPEPLEYVSYINGNSRKAEKIWKQADCVSIHKLERDLELNWEANIVDTSISVLAKFENYSVGSKTFLDSVNHLRLSCDDLDDFYKCELNWIYGYFRNLQQIDLKIYTPMKHF